MPSDERWIALSPLLDEALDLEPDERERWLAQLRAADPVRAAEIAAMLA